MQAGLYPPEYRPANPEVASRCFQLTSTAVGTELRLSRQINPLRYGKVAVPDQAPEIAQLCSELFGTLASTIVIVLRTGGPSSNTGTAAWLDAEAYLVSQVTRFMRAHFAAETTDKSADDAERLFWSDRFAIVTPHHIQVWYRTMCPSPQPSRNTAKHRHPLPQVPRRCAHNACAGFARCSGTPYGGASQSPARHSISSASTRSRSYKGEVGAAASIVTTSVWLQAHSAVGSYACSDMHDH